MIKNFLKQMLWPLVLFVLCFIVGATLWSLSETRHFVALKKEEDSSQGAVSNPYQDSKVLVTVEGNDITGQDIGFEFDLMTKDLQKSPYLASLPKMEDLTILKDKILESIVERKVLFHYVKEDKAFDSQNPTRYVSCLNEWMRIIKRKSKLLEDETNQERLKERLCENSLLDQYVNEKVYGKVIVTQEEIKTYYDQNKKSFRTKPKVKIRQILLAKEDQAKTIRAQANSHNFSQLAKQHSITAEGKSGGILKPFQLGEMPEVFDVVFSMETGQISEVLHSSYGFHIILLDQKIPSKDLSFEDAKSHIEKQIRTQKQEKEYQKWVDLALHAVSVTTPKVWQ